MAIGIAILGSGIFVTTEHLPAVKACGNFELKAVYSRSLNSAKKLEAGVDIYCDNHTESNKTLKDLLKRDDIHAVIIALPITVQPSIIKQCLLAGKHVLSEKPIAKDLATGSELISWRDSSENKEKIGNTLWAVAENFRYLESFKYAGDKVKELGKILSFKVQVYSYTDEDGKWYNTEWRKTPEYQGGFVLDGGVHFAAGLSIMLGQDEALQRVSAFTSQNLTHLPPVDTLAATCKTKNGKVGMFSLSWGTTDRGYEFVVATQGGVVSVRPGGKVEVKKVGKNQVEEKVFEDDGAGVKQEVQAFAESINSRKLDDKQTPEAALKDLEIIEKMLSSGDKGGEPQEIKG